MSGISFSGGGGSGGGTATTAVAVGLASARPAASGANSGTGYYASDTGELTISNGAAWNTLQSTSSSSWQMGANGILKSSGAAANFQLTGALALVNNGDLEVGNIGRGLQVKEGTNSKQGVATLAAGSSVVANTSVTATSRIQLTSNADGGTPGFLRVSARTAGTSFTITSSSGTDTSTVAWEMFEPGS